MTTELDLAELLHENTKNRPALGTTTAGPMDPAFALALMDRSIKKHVGVVPIRLPTPVSAVETDLCMAIRKRESVRTFQPISTPLTVLANVLYYGTGIRAAHPIDGFRNYRRNAPSAGNLGSVDLYPLVINVEGLSPGIYHYHPLEHSLYWVADQVSIPDLECALMQSPLCSAGAVVVLSSSLGRIRSKYGERGYRYACMDAGHAAQNICLVGVALGLGTCPIGSFCDDKLNDLLALDGVDEAAMYLVALGIAEA